jgi:hypothetical protein
METGSRPGAQHTGRRRQYESGRPCTEERACKSEQTEGRRVNKFTTAEKSEQNKNGQLRFSENQNRQPNSTQDVKTQFFIEIPQDYN